MAGDYTSQHFETVKHASLINPIAKAKPKGGEIVTSYLDVAIRIVDPWRNEATK